MGLCYYTTHTSHTSVMEPDHVVPSKDKQNDAAHGPGWYLTDLGPAACEKTLMCHCWPRTGSEQRVRQYVEVEIDGGCALKLRKHVYFVPESSASHLHLISQGQVLECTLKPCEACPLNPEKR